MDHVDDILDFIFKNGDLSRDVLFSDDDIPELDKDELKAIDAVMDHAESGIVDLLKACRTALLDKASGDPRS